MAKPLKAVFLLGTLKKKLVLSHTHVLCEVVAGALKSQENVDSEIVRLRDYDIQPGTKTEIDDDDWRIYSRYDEKMQSTIIVAELYNIRRELADDIARSNANILLITYPVFGLLVWFIISFALRSHTSHE